jgi:putative transposase
MELRGKRASDGGSVVANIVYKPGQYPWSSYGANGLGQESELVTPHSSYLALGCHTEERLASYRGLFEERLSAEEVNRIRQAIHYCLPLGDKAFCNEIEKRLGRKPGQPGRGRPKKKLAKK